MEIHQTLVGLSAILAIVLYYPLFKGILKGEIEQSFATWALWVVLDSITLESVLRQHGNYLMLAMYVAGGSVISCSLLYKKLFKWTWFETTILVLVIMCLTIRFSSGPWWATIWATIAVCISTLPQARESFKKPDRVTAHVYGGYVIVNLLSFLGGTSWTVQERFYPGMMLLLCYSVSFLALGKTKIVLSINAPH